MIIRTSIIQHSWIFTMDKKSQDGHHSRTKILAHFENYFTESTASLKRKPVFEYSVNDLLEIILFLC